MDQHLEKARRGRLDMPLDIVAGDMFDRVVDALVNPVNCVGVEGAGLAREFAVQFPLNSMRYRNACRSNRIRPGQVFAVTDVRPNGTSVTIVNFPTKLHWNKPSHPSYIESGMDSLVRFLVDNPNIRSVAVPALGCGLGGLRWPVVKKMVVDRMSPLDLDVYVFEPSNNRR